MIPGFLPTQNIKDEKRGISQSLKLFTIGICDKYFFFVLLGKKIDKNFSVFLKRREKKRH